MNINKNNYEAYILDFLEGNLSVSEREAVVMFAAEHPELEIDLWGDLPKLEIPRAQLDLSHIKKNLVWDEGEVSLLILEQFELDIDQYSVSYTTNHRLMQWKNDFPEAYIELEATLRKTYLVPVSVKFPEFNSGMAKLPVDHPEFDLVALLEGDISATEKADVEERLKENKTLQRTLNTYQATVLVSTKVELSSEFKKELKQKQARLIPLWLYRSVSVAAVLAIGFFTLQTFSDVESGVTAEFTPRNEVGFTYLENETPTEKEPQLRLVVQAESMTAMDHKATSVNKAVYENIEKLADLVVISPVYVSNIPSAVSSIQPEMKGEYVAVDISNYPMEESADVEKEILSAAEINEPLTAFGFVRESLLKKTDQKNEQALALSVVNSAAKKLSDEKDDFIVYEKAEEKKSGFMFRIGKLSIEAIR